MTITDVAVLGPGAIGGLLAALLTRAGFRTTCIGREAGGANGICVRSRFYGDLLEHPAVVTELDRSVQLLLITTKGPDFDAALDRVPPQLVADGILVPLLNGLGYAARTRRRFGRRVAAGAIGAIEATRSATGCIEHRSARPPRIELASDEDVGAAGLAEIARVLSAAGSEVAIQRSEADVVWRKLVRLNAIAIMNTASGLPVGSFRSDPRWRASLEAVVRESVAVARAEDVHIEADNVMREIDALPAELTTSLQRDIAAGRPSELDGICGGVIEAARRHGVPCPALEELVGTVRARST